MTLFFADISIYKKPSDLLEGINGFNSQSGDLCLLRCGESLYKLIAIIKPLSSARKWDIYPILDSFYAAEFSFNTKSILFSYDASSGRKGNIRDLSKLKDYIHVSGIKDFIENSIDILSYRTDRWDANILISIIQLTNNLEKEKTKKRRNKKSDLENSDIPFFTVVAGENLPWLTLKRYNNLNVTKSSPIAYLFRTSLIDNDVFSFCSLNGLVYLKDIIDAYNEYANFTSFEGDSLAIEESLKIILLYASYKGWTKLYTGNEDKSSFLTRRKNEVNIKNDNKKESKSVAEEKAESKSVGGTQKKSRLTTGKQTVSKSVDNLQLESNSVDGAQIEQADKLKRKKERTHKANNEVFDKKEKTIASHNKSSIDKNSNIVNVNLDNNIDNPFIKFEYMLSDNIIDEETYNCFLNNKCRIFQHLLTEYKKDPSLKKWKHLTSKVLKSIKMLTQYAIKKKWITNL